MWHDKVRLPQAEHLTMDPTMTTSNRRRRTWIPLALLALTLQGQGHAADYCCTCSNGRQETLSAEETDAQQTCIDTCVRQSMMDQRVEAQALDAAACMAQSPAPEAVFCGGVGRPDARYKNARARASAIFVSVGPECRL